MSRTYLLPRFTALLAILLLPVAAAAQTTPIAGVKGGVTVSNIDFSAEGLTVNFDSRIGGIGGVYAGADFGQYAGLTVEGLFSQKGTKTSDFDFDEDGIGDELVVVVNYVEIPILLHARLAAGDSTTVRIYGGPALAFKASDKQEVNGEELDEDDLRLKSYDVGVAVGASVTIRKFVIDARYTFGLLNVNDEDDSDEVTVKNRSFAVMFGWAFR